MLNEERTKIIKGESIGGVGAEVKDVLIGLSEGIKEVFSSLGQKQASISPLNTKTGRKQ
jgi:hypothetical protein